MAVYAQLADGRLLEFPDGTPQEVMDSAVKKFIASEKPPKTGIGAALVGGVERLGSSLQTGIESLFDAEKAARRGAEREEEISQKYAPGANLEAVKKAYEERGLFPAIGEVARQIPGALAEQAPNIAASLGSARLGAMVGAPLGPVGALVGGIGGAALPSILQIYGSGLERQAEENADISRGRALGAAVVGGGLETASTFIPLGRSIVGKLLGPQAEKALIRGERDAVENMARQGFAQTLGRGVAIGALAEIPTEVTQQILERAQAGLDLTSDDALAEYGQAAYGAALVGAPFGAAGRFAQRGVARGEIAEKEAKAREEEEKKAAAEAAARKLDPKYKSKLLQTLSSAQTEIAELSDIEKQEGLDPEVKKEIKNRLHELRTVAKQATEELAELSKTKIKPATLQELREQRSARVAENLNMPLFNEEEAKRAFFTTDKGDIAQYSLLPEQDELAQAKTEDELREKQRLAYEFNNQNRVAYERIQDLSREINEYPNTARADNARVELERLQNIRKQLADEAKKQNIKLINVEAQTGAQKEEIVAARKEVLSFTAKIQKAFDLGEFSKIPNLHTRLKEAQAKVNELSRTPELFGSENIAREERREQLNNDLEEALYEYGGYKSAPDHLYELYDRAKTERRFDKEQEDKKIAKANRFEQLSRYVEQLQNQKGVELLGVTPENKERVERMLAEGSLPPELSQQMFGINNLSFTNVKNALDNLLAKQKEKSEAFVDDDNLLLNDKGLLTKEGAEFLRDDIRVKELGRLLERQQKLREQRTDFEAQNLGFEEGDFAPITEKIVPLAEKTEPIEPETEYGKNNKDRNVLMTYFRDVIYALQRGVFIGDRFGIRDEYDEEYNQRLNERLQDVRIEKEIVKAQIASTPQGSENLQRRLAQLDAREKIIRAGMTQTTEGAFQKFDELYKEAQSIRDQFIARAMAEVNAARLAKNMPELKPNDKEFTTLQIWKGKPREVKVSLPELLREQFDEFIKRAANAKRGTGTTLERAFAKVGFALDTLQEYVENDITRAKGEKTLQEEINEKVEVESGATAETKTPVLEQRGELVELLKKIDSLQEELSRKKVSTPVVGKAQVLIDTPVKDEDGKTIFGRGYYSEEGTEKEIANLEEYLKAVKDLQKTPQDLFDVVVEDPEFAGFVKPASILEIQKKIADTKKLLAVIQQKVKGPEEILTQLTEAEKRVAEIKKSFESNLTDENKRAALKDLLQEQLDEIRMLEEDIKNAGEQGAELSQFLKLAQLKADAENTKQVFKQYLDSADRVKIYPKTEELSSVLDRLLQLEEAGDRAQNFIKKITSDIRFANDTNKKLTLLDNQLLALESAKQTETTKKRTTQLKNERKNLIDSANKRFKYLENLTGLPSEDIDFANKAKAKVEKELKELEVERQQILAQLEVTFTEEEEKQTSIREYVKAEYEEVKLLRRLKEQILKALPTTKEEKDNFNKERERKLKLELATTNHRLAVAFDKLKAKGQEFAQINKKQKEKIKTAEKAEQEETAKLFEKLEELNKKQAELAARVKELSYPFASNIVGRDAVELVIQEETEPLNAHIAELNKKLAVAKEDLIAAQTQLADAEARSTTGKKADKQLALVDVQNANNLIDIHTKEVARIEADIKDSEESKQQLIQNLKEETKKVGAENKYGQSLRKIKSLLEAELPRIKHEVGQTEKALKITDAKATSLAKLRLEKTDKLAEDTLRYITDLKTKIGKANKQVKELMPKEYVEAREKKARLNAEINSITKNLKKNDALAPKAKGKFSPEKRAEIVERLNKKKKESLDLAKFMSTFTGERFSGVRVEFVTTGRKVSSEFEISERQLETVEKEIEELSQKLAEDDSLPADSKNKLSPTARKKLQGQLDNRRGRRFTLLESIDPSRLSVEIDLLNKKLATTTVPKQKKRILDQIQRLEKRIKAENEVYEISRKVTYFTTIRGNEVYGDVARLYAEPGKETPAHSFFLADTDVAKVYAESAREVRENHVQASQEELDAFETAKKEIKKNIAETEADIATQVAYEQKHGGARSEIAKSKRKLRDLRAKYAQLTGLKVRKGMSDEELEREISKIKEAETVAEVQLSDDSFFEALELDDVSGLVNTSGGTVEWRIGNAATTAIDTEKAIARLEKAKKKAASLNIKFEYYKDIASLPEPLLDQLAAQGLDGTANRIKGGVGPDGVVFVVVENHESMIDLEKTLTHELVGHYSFSAMLGKEGLLNLMLKLEKSFATEKNKSGLENLAEELGLKEEYEAALREMYLFYKDRFDKKEISERDLIRIAKINGMKELVAYTMEKRVTEKISEKIKRFYKEIVGAIRSVLRKLGLLDAANMTTSDLFYLMKRANDTFNAGKPLAYRNSNGTVSFRTAEKPPATGLSALISQRGSFFDAVKANTLGMSGLNFRTQFVDRLAALDALVKRGVEKKVVSSLKAMDVMYFSRMVDQRNNFVSEFATNGVGKITLKNGERMYTGGTGPSLRDVSEALRDSGIDPKQVENAFTEYLIALRATKVGLKKLDFSGKTTQADVDASLAKYKNNEAFKKAAKLYDEYNDNLLDFLASTGAISEADAAKMKGQNYVPYYREANGGIELVISKELAPIRIGDFKDQPHLNELKGGEDKVVPAFTGMLQNTSLIVDLALRNMATRNTAHVLQDMGVMKIYKGEGPASAEVIRFKRDGEKFYAIPDKEAKDTLFGDIPIDLVIRGMEGIKTTIPGIVRMLGVPSNILRKFVTRNPKYAVNQISRDSMAAVMTTGADFIPIVDTVKDLMTMKKSGALRTLQGSGAIGGQVITGASDDMAKILQQIAAGKTGWELAMAKLDELAMMGDAATRVSMYNSFLKQGLSEREATFATLEAMNFGRRGLSPSMTFANIMIPFFNANVQGLDVLWRAFKGDMPASERLRVRNKLIARGMLMAAFTFAYAAAMDDDETYENANPDERYGNWFVPTPIGTVRVPIPFELGFIFKAIPEGVYRYAFTDDKGSAVAKAMGSMLMKSVPGDLPTAIKVPVELALNKSFYTGRPIIDEKLQGLVSSEQYKPNTPELIKMFGAIGLSPVQVEYFIRGFTGTLPVALMRIVDPVFVSSEDKPEMKLEELPVIGGFFQPKDAGGLINAAFEHVKQAREAQQTYKHMIEEGRLEDAKKFLQENIADVSLASAAGSFRQQMGKIVKAEQAIRASALSPEEKRARLDEMRELKIKMAKQFTSVSEQIKARTSP